MTIATVPLVPYPFFPVLHTINTTAATSNVNLMTFDGTGDRLALITRMPVSGTLTEVLFRTGTVSTAGATFQIQIEGVDANGLPDGVAKYTNANGTVVVATSDDNVWKTVSINGGTGVSTTKGDLIAIVLSVSSGTPNTVIISTAAVTGYNLLGLFPYIAQDTAGSWSKYTSLPLAAPFALNFSGTYVPCHGASSINATAATAPGSGNERALRFQLPVPMRVAGMRAYLSNMAAGADFRMVLYDSTPTVIAQIEHNGGTGADIDGDVAASTTHDGWYEGLFNSSQSLSANTTYYASIYQKTANSVLLYEVQFTTTSLRNAYTSGSACYLGTRSGGSGSFSDTTTTVPLIQLLVDGFDDGTGSGSGSHIQSRVFTGM